MHWLKLVNSRITFIRNLLFFGGLLWYGNSNAQKSSTLSSGQLYKLSITQTGVHKIDVNFLKSMGVDAASVNPEKIRLFGNGGKMLPQRNADKRPDNPTENAIWIQGGEDGRFDAGDAIFFYAESPHVILADSLTSTLSHQINHYSDTTFYFLSIGSENGLRIKNESTISNKQGIVITEFEDYWYHEKNSINLLRSGREWWGEYIGTAPFVVQADLPGIVAGSEIRFSGSAVGAAQIPTRFLWQLNGQLLGDSAIRAVGSGTYDIKGQQNIVNYTSVATGNASPVSLSVSYDRKGQGSAQAYLNFLGIQVKRELAVYDKQQIYRFFPSSKDTVTYQFKNGAAEWQFWNITDSFKPSFVPISGNSATLTHGRRLRSFIGFHPSQALVPESWQAVPNQNLMEERVPDMLIVTAPLWKNQAERLASFREENDGMDVLVVTTGQVYNEFASGKADISAIRDFAKKLHDKEPDKLKYLLLFGDATFDYKNNLLNQSESICSNWVPVYESRESLNPVYTHSSDDYFGFMDADEGNWIESESGDHLLDIGVGRLPVKTIAEAQTVVDKIIRYSSSPKGMAGWRNTIHFVADDGDGKIHQRDADLLAQLAGKQFLPSRIFLDAFPQIITPLGQRVPKVNEAIGKSINDGVLVLNYTGHGGTSGWAEEQVLTLNDMLSVRGLDNMPLLLTATCDFGRYDDPGLVSGAEIMVLSPKGGAIGAVTTTRPVYSSTNFTINKAFYDALLNAGPDARLGDIFRETKNKGLAGALNRNFTLLGDPSLRLAKPEKRIRFAGSADTLRALAKVSIQLEVIDARTGVRDPEFQGTARIAVYDKQTVFKTLGNQDSPESYSEFRSKLFDGSVTVRDGKISCEFVMPKDIDYRLGVGRISVYAVSADSLTDAGDQLDVAIGGSAPMITDNTPPKISAWLNNKSFRNGDVVGESPQLIVEVSDESGINVSKAGIGHDITMTLNDTLVITLNDYYTADLDKYTSGTITYPFQDLPTGNYTVRIKVWDIYTNSSEIAFGFQVQSATGIKLTDLKVFPNPFDKDLSFEMSHNRPNEDVDVTFRLFLTNGQQLGSVNWTYYYSDPVIRESVSSTRLGSLLNRMISYIYTVEVRSLKDNSVDKRSGKIIRSP
ncbi:type IX secretion system sortase PorU [Dyadobacter sp. CY312]|uniref:type IX secretion system sortase PorU n=1 Tax=Dyadobacter sp. CY312 TaxID=2907303 RepID=UPI001F282A32|nr:type IX secretion system sortase PorU [Dyadobacter sp. CY312]MCE7041004.1 type IX secretion system sortase PorU [Dyadobacter sp. CY312]